MDLLWCMTNRQPHQMPTSATRIGSDDVTPSAAFRDLGILFDIDLSMKSHVQWTCASLIGVRRSVPLTVYQSNAAARSIAGRRRANHITYTLVSLHWLRVKFNGDLGLPVIPLLCSLVWYADDLRCTADMPLRSRLRSSSSNQLYVYFCALI